MIRPLLILNAGAGPDELNETRVAEIRRELASETVEPEVVFTSEETPAAELARHAVEEGREMVLVGGGDGTVSEVARVLVRTGVTLGILPIGTFNNIARSLGVLADLPAACAVVREGYTREIDIGIANDEHPFFEAAGIGLDATLFPIGEEIKGGRWTRMFEAARLTMQYRRVSLEFTFAEPLAEVLPSAKQQKTRRREQQRHKIRRRVLLAVVANGPYYGGGFTVAPAARLTDGRLTVTIYRRFSKLELIRHFWSISRGRYRYSPKVETFNTREVTIESVTPRPVHVDGKPLGQTPVNLKVLAKALRVVVARGKKGEDEEPPVALPAEARREEEEAHA